ncbi:MULTISPECIES: sialidase family protein [unclassified Micromonospora]|uniref:sialidase family protein n=1 Tax=unclassified Micromonospora TaxID=2617518 RepID=UPI0033175A8E
MSRLWSRNPVLAVTGLVVALVSTTVPAVPVAAADAVGPALTVIDSWDVTGPHTFPDAGGGVLQAQRPALTQAPNGDLLAAFNTSGDAHPGGQLRMIRSSDSGRTWGPSTVVAEPRLFGDRGSISAQRGMATLSDGTILLPYNDAVNHVNYNNRESVLFVARSTDNGHTWTGTDEPVALPIPIREAHIGGSPILELGDGTLLLPIWGALELVDGWETDPMRWRSGVLRSFDGGRTWSDYRTIAYDPNNPPQFPPFHSARYTSGANELALQDLPDGRVVAVVRYASGVGPNRGQVYLSYSSDHGATWTAPVATGQQAEALSLTIAPCTGDLPVGTSKLLMGHRYLDAAGTRTGRAAIRSSFDGGVTWAGETFLVDPGGATNLGAATGEPAFHRLSDDRLLVLFQVSLNGAPFKIVANVVEDATDPADCRAQATDAAARATANPTVFLDRADRDRWPWPFASRKATSAATETVGDLLESHASALTCRPGDRLNLIGADGQPLDRAATLAEAGVANGSVLRVGGDPSTGLWRIGHSELDVFPGTRHLYGWDEACATASLALDYRGRALGLDVDLPAGHAVSAVELRDTNGSSRLVASDYRLFTSADNDTYREVPGWTFSSRVQDGRLVHRFDGLSVTDRYVKVHQRWTNTAYTFVVGDPRSDVRVEFSRLPCAVTITGHHDGPLTATGVTCVQDARLDGPVTVDGGGQLVVTDSVIHGPVRASGAAAVRICGTELDGPLTVSHTSGLVQVGDATNDCAPNSISGSVFLTGNAGGVRLAGNTIAGPLECVGNDPSPIDIGEPNAVTGKRSGQCAPL